MKEVVMEKLKRVIAWMLLVCAMSTTAIGLIPDRAFAAATGACDAAGCDAGDTKCAVIETSILWGLITITTTCFDKPKSQ